MTTITHGYYRKKPITIEAMRVPSIDRPIDVLSWIVRGKGDAYLDNKGHLKIHTLEGIMTAGPGDWVIKGVKGEFYPCKPDVFEATYEAAEAPA